MQHKEQIRGRVVEDHFNQKYGNSVVSMLMI